MLRFSLLLYVCYLVGGGARNGTWIVDCLLETESGNEGIC